MHVVRMIIQFKTFSNAIHEQRNDHLRDLLEFKAQQSIHISEVESVESIVKRFNTANELWFYF